MAIRWRLVPMVLSAWVLVAGAELGAGQEKRNQEGLEALIAQAVANNPEVRASDERWRMSVARARQAGVLDDPMMMLRIQNALIRDPLDFGRDVMTAKVIGLSQKLPFYGKRELMRQEADFEAEAERWTVEERRIELRRLVKETWFQLYLVDRSLDTVHGTLRLLDDLIRLAETMYSVGQTGQQEVFQAQVERSRMEEMRLGLEQKRRSLAVAFNTLVYRPVETAVPVPGKLSLPVLTLSAAELEQLALTHRPLLKSLEARIDKAAAAVRLAEKERYPDFTVSLEYMQREPAMDTPGDDMYGAELSFNLPIQSDRRQARIAETEAEKRMAMEELAAQRNRIRQVIGDALAQLDRSRKVIRLYDQGMLAQAGSASESAMAAYRTGKTRFAEVLASRMSLFALEREYHGAVAEHQLQLAALEGVVGAPLPAGRP